MAGGGEKAKLILEAQLSQKGENTFKGKVIATVKKGKEELIEGAEIRIMIDGIQMPIPNPTDENGKTTCSVEFETEIDQIILEGTASTEYGDIGAKKTVNLKRKKKNEIADIRKIAAVIQDDTVFLTLARVDEFSKSLKGNLMIVEPAARRRTEHSDDGIFDLEFAQDENPRTVSMIAPEKPDIQFDFTIPARGTTLEPEKKKETVVAEKPPSFLDKMKFAQAMGKGSAKKQS